MKIVRETDKHVYRFVCKTCGSLLEASVDDLKFVKPGVLRYTCPKCRKEKHVKERKITIIPVLEEIKNIKITSEEKKA